MAKRYIGDAIVTIAYHDSGDYRGTIRAYKHTWKFDGLRAPAMGHGPGIAYDSSEAYDRMAVAAVSFGGNFGTHNRGGGPDTSDETLAAEGYPDAETADAINDATTCVMTDNGRYEVRRSAGGLVRTVP
jgi:hypothetical protein